MELLYRYSEAGTGVFVVVLFLAGESIRIFSLLDPLIFRHIIDNYATQYKRIHERAVHPRRERSCWRGGRRRVRLARGQEFPGLLRQRDHAAGGRDDLRRRHPPLARTALLRSSKTSAAARRWASCRKSARDVEKFITRSVNMVFTTLIGVVFVMIYAVQRALVDRACLPAHRAAARRPELGAEPQDQDVQKTIVAETTALAGCHHRIAAQYRAREEPGPGAAGNRAAECDDRQDSQAGAEEGAVPAQSELHPGNVREPAAHVDPVPDALPDLHAADHGRAVLLAVHLLVLHLRPAAGTGQRHQHLSRDRSVAAELSRRF